MVKLRKTKTGFIKVRCEKCKNEQNVFSTITTKVNCLICGEVLAEPTGGKSRFKGKALETLP